MRIKKKDLYLLFQIEMFMLPSVLLNNSFFSVIWYGILLCVIGIFLSKVIFRKLRIGTLKGIWYLTVYMLIQAICTRLNHGPWVKNVLSLIVVFMLCCFFEDRMRDNTLKVVSVFKCVLLFNICLENIFYLLSGFSILGSLACGYVYYVVWATLSLFQSKSEKRKNMEVLPISLLYILVTIIKPQIDTNGANYEWTFYVIAILFCFVTVFGKGIVKLKKLLNGRVVFVTIIALNLIFVFFSIQSKIPIFRFIIENVMHKDIGLTGRSGIWDFAKRLILLKPIYGYGTGLTTLGDEGYWYDFMKIYGPHNQFLYIMLAGGIITLIPYIVLLFHVFFSLEKNKQYSWSMIFSLGLLGMYLELMVTYRTYATCMPLFALFTIIDFMCNHTESNGKYSTKIYKNI